ncbi:unnamed protein product, partial [Pleuronectes platessa]
TGYEFTPRPAAPIPLLLLPSSPPPPPLLPPSCLRLTVGCNSSHRIHTEEEEAGERRGDGCDRRDGRRESIHLKQFVEQSEGNLTFNSGMSSLSEEEEEEEEREGGGEERRRREEEEEPEGAFVSSHPSSSSSSSSSSPLLHLHTLALLPLSPAVASPPPSSPYPPALLPSLTLSHYLSVPPHPPTPLSITAPCNVNSSRLSAPRCFMYMHTSPRVCQLLPCQV